MANQAITRTVVLTANQAREVGIAGRYLLIQSCTVSTIEVAFDGRDPQIYYPRMCYPGPAGGFTSFLVRDRSGAGCTVVLAVADTPIVGQADAADMASMVADIADVKTNVAKPTSKTLLAQTTVVASAAVDPVGPPPVPATTIFAARARRRLHLVAGAGNTGSVYLVGVEFGVIADAFHELTPGGIFDQEWPFIAYAVSDNGTEIVRGYEIW